MKNSPPSLTRKKKMDQNSDANICRICLNVQDTLFSLYRKRHGTSPYEKLISRTKLSIKLDDAGPPSICSQCLIDLDTTVCFLERCERSNQLLAARFARGDSSNFKADLLEAESEHKLVSSEPPEATEEAIEVKSIAVIVQDEKCPECGSKRRCKHWSPPATHSCHFCGKTFNKKYNYQMHIKRHLGENDFSCRSCGSGQLTRWAAQQHCRPRLRQLCPVPGCGKSFTTNTNLNIHIRKHSGERPFECDECGKTFISKNILNNHMRIHTGVKPYMCQVCGKQFATNKLSAHMTSHAHASEPPALARRHACPRAGCDKAFRSGRALRSHGRTHSAQRAFACALCAAPYKFKQSLNYHVKNTHGVAKKTTVRPASPIMASNCNNNNNCIIDKDCEF